MKVLLTGATGFIGSRLRASLLARGHELVCAARRAPPPHAQARWLECDFATWRDAGQWQPHLRGIEVVVNTVGLFRERGTQTFAALHVEAPRALFDACVAAGVPRVVQLSALGAQADAPTAYWRSKHAADAHLLGLPLDAVIAQPSLVFGPGGASARWFLTLASLPLLPLPEGGTQAVQPVHLDDAVQALVALVEAAPARALGRRVALVGPRASTLAAYLQALRAALGLRPARTVAVPGGLVDATLPLAAAWPGSLLDRASWTMLQRGNTAPADDITALLGRPPRTTAEFVAREQAAGERVQARLGWLLPLLRLAIAFVWIATAVVSFGLFPVAQSYELLARTGVPAAWQPWLLYGAATLDLLLGVATLALAQRWRPRLWLVQAALMLGYMVIIAWRLPEFWLHPYGPLTKNVPLLAALVLLYVLDRPEDERWTT